MEEDNVEVQDKCFHRGVTSHNKASHPTKGQADEANPPTDHVDAETDGLGWAKYASDAETAEYRALGDF
ncbi:Hypothetical predicted protein [Olea europaea subsp. europaea]|uniref:Uncharacterized protein n=1 Tax=Olea europaea subsp. europaea TaxID=158383 RepID=A0A8S0RL63_OLEEU|nr:Hypothetical predicted protein [Olea europaea subsp. europaea]